MTGKGNFSWRESFALILSMIVRVACFIGVVVVVVCDLSTVLTEN